MTEHTQTPWEFIDATKEASMQYKPLCIIKSGEKQIASFSWNDNSPWFPSKLESQANAALIVKAVNQYDDAHTALLELCGRHGLATGHGDTLADIVREIDGQIRTFDLVSTPRGE